MSESSLETTASVADMYPSHDWQVVADDTIVTHDSQGRPRSWFRDDSWNIDAYGKNHRGRNILFRDLAPADTDVILAFASRVQAKQVMFFLMHQVADDVPAPGTLKGKLNVLRDFCGFTAARGQTLYQGMADSETVLAYIQREGAERKAQSLHSVLVQLHRLGVSHTGVEIPLRKLHAPMMGRFAERKDTAQYPVIPTRIYQHFLATCEKELEAAEAASEALIIEIGRAYDGDLLSKELPPNLVRLMKYFGLEFNILSIARLVNEVRMLCQILILAFTGMRSAEAATLPFDCLKVVYQDGVPHYTVEGITTKLTGGRAKRACWVTSHLAARAVKLAQQLSGEAHRRFGREDYATCTDGTHLLFCRTGLFQSTYELGRGPNGMDEYLEKLRRRIFLTIAEEDIKELKRVDPFRAWDDELNFAQGNQWPFTRHQLRRTLALYAHRSGLVALPSLKRQLQHITLEMSMYYARGSAFAKDLLSNEKKHFARDWSDAQGLSEYLAYATQVLFSDERLFGGHVAWAKSGRVQQSPVSVYAREKTVAMFEKGQLAYRETVLGGCVSTEPCKSSPLNWLPLQCLESNCKSLVVVPSKLQRVIKAQERRVETLKAFAIDSVEYRMEAETLENLLAAQDKMGIRIRG